LTLADSDWFEGMMKTVSSDDGFSLKSIKTGESLQSTYEWSLYWRCSCSLFEFYDEFENEDDGLIGFFSWFTYFFG
jgi:hypothetical protein